MRRIYAVIIIMLCAHRVFAAQPTLLWLDGVSGARATALRNAFFSAELVTAKQSARATKEAARHHPRGDAALRAKVEALSTESKSTIVYIHPSGHDEALIAVQDASGLRTTTLRLPAQPPRAALLEFVNFATAPTTAPPPVEPVPIVTQAASVPAVTPPVVVAPEAAPAPTAVLASEPPPPPAPTEPPWSTHLLEVSLGGGTISRRLTLQNIATGNMASYALNAAPAISGTAAVAPLVLSHYPIVRDWQLYGEMGGAPGFASANPNTGGNVTTQWFYWRAGLALRFRTGDLTPTIAADVSYGGESFSFSSAGVLVSQVPSVSYALARFGGAIEQPIGSRWKLAAVGGFRLVPSGGYLATRFAGTRIIGYDVGGQVTAKLWGGFSVQLVGGYTRYGYSLHPKQTDPYVATGAIDELPYGALRLCYQI